MFVVFIFLLNLIYFMQPYVFVDSRLINKNSQELRFTYTINASPGPSSATLSILTFWM